MPITHELFGQHLRLGNFCAKIAWSIAACKKYNCEVSYPRNYYLWENLKNPPILYDQEPTPAYILRPRVWEYNQQEEEWLDTFENDFQELNVSVALNFFFQSYLAFQGYEKEVKEFFTPHNQIVLNLFGKYKEMFNGKPTIGVGIRLGDFIGHGDFAQIPFDWYIRALNANFNRNEYNIVVFSDDIDRAKEIFKGQGFLYPEPNGTQTHAENFKHYHSGKAAEQFFLGTMMDNWIIGNSTFSWWQAFLSGGTTIHSGRVFSEYGNMKHCDTSTYYRPEWIKFDL